MDWNKLPERLRECGIKPDVLHLHQHFLIDEGALYNTVNVAKIKRSETVMEIGAGVGNITEFLAQRANRVIAYEIDKRFKVFLNPLADTYPNLTIRFEDVKKAKWPRFDCLVANVPFNLLEPISLKLAQAKFRSTVLIVGNRFRQFVGESFSLDRITRFSVMMHAFFQIREHHMIEKGKFYPEPAIDAVVVELISHQPKTCFLQFCRKLLENQNKLVGHIMKLCELRIDLPINMLNKRADRLSNSDFQTILSYFK